MLKWIQSLLKSVDTAKLAKLEPGQYLLVLDETVFSQSMAEHLGDALRDRDINIVVMMTLDVTAARLYRMEADKQLTTVKSVNEEMRCESCQSTRFEFVRMVHSGIIVSVCLRCGHSVQVVNSVKSPNADG